VVTSDVRTAVHAAGRRTLTYPPLPPRPRLRPGVKAPAPRLANPSSASKDIAGGPAREHRSAPRSASPAPPEAGPVRLASRRQGVDRRSARFLQIQDSGAVGTLEFAADILGATTYWLAAWSGVSMPYTFPQRRPAIDRNPPALEPSTLAEEHSSLILAQHAAHNPQLQAALTHRPVHPVGIDQVSAGGGAARQVEHGWSIATADGVSVCRIHNASRSASPLRLRTRLAGSSHRLR
jgi:hypothetical protein